MWGVTVNALAIVAGSLIGILFKDIVSEKASKRPWGRSRSSLE